MMAVQFDNEQLSIIPRIDQYRSKLIDDSSQWQFSYPKNSTCL